MKKEANQKVLRLEILVLVILSAILIWIVGLRYSAQLVTEKVFAADATALKVNAKIVRDEAAEKYIPPVPVKTEDPEPDAEPEVESEAVIEDVAEVLSVDEPEVVEEPVEEPVVTPTNEMPVVAQPEYGRYGNLLLTSDEIETIARLVKLEAGGESFTGQQAVAEVILNRVLSPVYPNNVYDVVYQPYQFSPSGYIPYTVATQTQYDAVNAALSGQNILPQQVLYFATSQNGRSEVWGWIGGHCFCY